MSALIILIRCLWFLSLGMHAPIEGTMAQGSGFLSSLLGHGRECEGYKVRLVGHSLGGAVATLLGLRLKGRYPNLHVYAYGTLPCVDSVIAEACSDFVTTIVYNDEFSARLSVNSIIRLRAAAIQALSHDASANSAVIAKLARRILNVQKHVDNAEIHMSASPTVANPDRVEDGNHIHRKPMKHSIQGGFFLCGLALSCMTNTPNHQHASNAINRAYTSASVNNQPNKQEAIVERSTGDDSDSGILSEDDCYYAIDMPKNGDALLVDHQIDNFNGEIANNSTFLWGEESPSSNDLTQAIETIELKEVFLPGLIIHIIPEQKKNIAPLWRICLLNGEEGGHKAYVANRENFMDMVVSPYMFLDHLPWRVCYAMQRVLETQKSRDQSVSGREDTV